MSRSRSRNTRVIRNNANLRLSLPSRSLSRPSLSMMEIEDRRQFHPSGRQRGAALFNVSHHNLQATPSRRRLIPKSVSFVTPDRVLLCVRRKIRKEVMFAKGGAGSKKMRRPKRNHYSDVRC